MTSSHQVAKGSSYSVDRDSYIIMVNITAVAATSKDVYAVSLAPHHANANDVTDGDFGTCISTEADTDPW